MTRQSFLTRQSIFAALTAVFLAVYWLAAHRAGVHVGGDTTAFEQAARDQHGWSGLFATSRPPLYPLLIRAARFSRPAVVAVQTVLYLAAWTALAAVVAGRSLWLAAGVFYLALWPGFAAWNPVLMTESPQITLTVAAVACLLAFARGGRAGPAAFAGFVALMLAKCAMRDFDALVALFFVPMIVGAALLRRLSWPAALAACALFVAAYVFTSRVTGGMADATWLFAMFDEIGLRVLPDPALRQFFVAHGMPLNDALLAMTGQNAIGQNWRFWSDPALAAFRDWLRLHGRTVYAEYMLTHPVWTFAELWRARGVVFQATGLPSFYYFDPRYRLDLPPWPPFLAVYALDAIGAAVLALQAVRRWTPETAMGTLVAGTLMLMLPPLAAIVYHADPLEIVRHALPLPLHAALCLVALLDLMPAAHAWGRSAAASRPTALASEGWRSKSQLATGQGRGRGG